MFKLIGGRSGLAIMTVIIFVLNTLININDIYFDQKSEMKERKEKRLRERELEKYDYEK